MYVPKHFELEADRVAALLATAETAQLVTAHPDGPVATLLPVAYRPATPGSDGLGSLVLHVTRVNSQWKDPHLGDALAILDGPDAYVDPTWVPSHAEAPGVPTWNYVTVHCYGDLVVHDDPDWTRGAVAELSARHGYDTAQVDPEAIERMLRAVVGLELVITRVVAKAKLSQNRAPDDVAGIIAGLGGPTASELAAAMAEISLPHAQARHELIGEIRSGRRLGAARPTTS